MSVELALKQLAVGNDIPGTVLSDAMQEIMSGQAETVQVGAMLMGLVVKGETSAELTAAAGVMREFAHSVSVQGEHVLDTCGTGGDGLGIFNVSTACALICAEAGVKVAKHGNRSVSSTTGSADVLEAAGLNLDLTPEQVADCIERFNIGFLYARRHHPAVAHVAGIRKSLGIRTLFNLLGPLTNPAAAPCQLLGVYDRRWLVPVAETLRDLGSRHVMVVNAVDGLDEISIAAPTDVAELQAGEISEYQIQPESLVGHFDSLKPLCVDDASASLDLIKNALQGQPGPAYAMLAINAGAGIYVAGKAQNLAAGVEQAKVILNSGNAWKRLQSLVAHSQQVAQ